MEISPFDEEINRREVPALKVHPIVLGDNGDDLFAAGVADMDFKPPECVLGAMQKRLDHGVFGYETVPDQLLPGLVGWLAKQHQWHVDQSHILRAPNVLNALAMAISLFSDNGDGIIVQPPVFFDFFDVIRENNRKLIQNPLLFDGQRYTFDFAGLAKLASAPQTKILLLCNPHNPVGRVWRPEELRELGEICAVNDVLVVADEMHGDLVFKSHKYTPFASLGAGFSDNCITCTSPAKTFNLASCSAAFTIISDDHKRQLFQAENSRLTVNKNNAFANVAMAAAFQDGAFWLDEVLEYIEGNFHLLQQRLQPLSGVQVIEPEGTFLVWLDFRARNLSPEDLTVFLREKAGWAVSRGEAFGAEGAGFARVNIACTRKKLGAALNRLEMALGE